MDNRENIDELISKFLSGEASPEEAISLEDWKTSSPENLSYFNSCKKLFDAASRGGTVEINKALAWEKVKPVNDTKIKPLYTSYWRIAASVTVIVGLASLLFYMFRQKDVQLLSYAAEETEKNITMDDSSLITIAPHSQLTYSDDFGKTNRKVLLKGSAYFSVVHHDSLPFIVDAGDVFIKDIGTKFSINPSLNNDTLHVNVDEGIVLLYDNTGAELTVNANEKAVYIRSEKKIRKIPVLNTITSVLNFDLNKKTLKEIVIELSRAYHIRIELESAALEDCRVTTQFNNEDIETILTIITETLGLNYVKIPEGYRITGNKCNG